MYEVLVLLDIWLDMAAIMSSIIESLQELFGTTIL